MNKNEIRNIFSANLKQLLKDQNKNRKDLANDLNIAYSRVCDWSRARTLPTDDEMISFFTVIASSLTNTLKAFNKECAAIQGRRLSVL